MAGFMEVYEKYRGEDTGNWGTNQMEEITSYLSEVLPDELKSLEDHKNFLELLHLLRVVTTRFLSFVGEDFPKTIRNLLAVGADGIYGGDLRFIYELVQNADDCEYDDPQNRKLDILFDTSRDVIELTYNEKGFKPKDVYAITAIAERIKNIDEEVKIGEKGLGFKSVFGVAESVAVHSGKFSFEFHKDNFTIPQLRYENFTGITGTKIALWLKANETDKLYQKIEERYSGENSLLHNNPILFLNKLTSIRLYTNDGERHIKFSVLRQSAPVRVESCDMALTREEKVFIEADIVAAQKEPLKKEISCYRYVMPVIYDRAACESRYGEKIEFQKKEHKLVALFPSQPDELKEGGFYSFLPTEIKLTVPLLIHAPYKLNASRENIDPQDKNLWFEYTSKNLSDFIKCIYTDLAAHVKEGIVKYLPGKNDYIFRYSDHLKTNYFRGNILSGQKLFYTTAGTFETAEDVVSLDVDKPAQVHSLLSQNKPLFIPPEGVKANTLVKYGIEVIPKNKVHIDLFKRAIEDASVTEEIFKILSDVEKFEYDKAVDQLNPSNSITVEQLSIICGDKEVYKAFQENAIKQIKKDSLPILEMASPAGPLDERKINILRNVAPDLHNDRLKSYIEKIQNRYTTLSDIAPDGGYFVCSNMLILSSKEAFGAFAAFAGNFDEKLVRARLEIEQESENLKMLIQDESCDNATFLKRLHDVRSTEMGIFDREGHYSRFITLINKSGTNKYNFLNELLQNADDCVYNTNKVPTFDFKYDDEKLIVSTVYNEDGFKKPNVTAITAIGESTKGFLESSDSIGNKGVGFKSVFNNIASKVEIHSNGFDFELTKEKPTVPVPIKAKTVKNQAGGTEMMFYLDNPLPVSEIFSEERVVKLCLCLRKLKKLRFMSFNVEIEDGDADDYRKIRINGKEYRFSKFRHDFTVNEDEIRKERDDQHRQINPLQKIFFYVTNDNTLGRYLYNGLPSEIELKIPLMIDAPFELTTSREEIITQGDWYERVREEMYNALIKFMHSIKNRRKYKIFKYVDKDGITSDSSLNEYQLVNRISQEELVYLANGEFSSPKDCRIYVDKFCHDLLEKRLVSVPSERIVGYVPNNYKDKAHILGILERLGCKRSGQLDELKLIKEAVEDGHIDKFRKELYDYLKSKSSGIHSNKDCSELLCQFKIIPVKPLEDGTKPNYISLQNSSQKEIFIDSDKKSPSEYYLLDEKRLKAEDFNDIFGEHIRKMNPDEKHAIYAKKITGYLDNRQLSEESVVEKLLYEYEKNKSKFIKCKNELKGRIDDIPYKSCDGNFYTGERFINETEVEFKGNIAKIFCVERKYLELFKFLDCSSIFKITHDIIKISLAPPCDQLTSEDIEDFLRGEFENKTEIFRRCIENGKISQDLIKKHNLGEYVLIPEERREEWERLQKVEQKLRDHGIITDDDMEKVLELWEKEQGNHDIPELPPDGDEGPEQQGGNGSTPQVIDEGIGDDGYDDPPSPRIITEMETETKDDIEKELENYIPPHRIDVIIDDDEDIIDDGEDTSSDDSSDIDSGPQDTDAGDVSTPRTGSSKRRDFGDEMNRKNEQHMKEMAELNRKKHLSALAAKYGEYSYFWFRILLEMELIERGEDSGNSWMVSISFSKVERETERVLVLRFPNREIPQFMEDFADIPLELYSKGTRMKKKLPIEVISVHSDVLRVKLKPGADINDDDLKRVTEAQINAKKAVFLMESLRDRFCELNFEKNFDMLKNLCPNIEFVFGPPGTGKTTHLADKIIIPIMRGAADKKILVLTPTNKAADVLVRRVIEIMGEDSGYLGWLVRFANTYDEAIEESGVLREKTFDILGLDRSVTVATIDRFPYDYFISDDKRKLYLCDMDWDYIIFDEASMIPLVKIIYPLYAKKPEKFYVAGDPFQIDPIVKVNEWEGRNIYTMTGLNSFDNPSTVPHNYPVTLLKTQYRSIPAVGEIFSQFKYGGNLAPHRTDDSRRHLFDGTFDEPLNIIKFPVSQYESVYKAKSLNEGSHYHIYSALFTAEFVKYISGIMEKTRGGEPVSIGVIAPYRVQANLVDKLISSAALPKNINAQAATVHGFQGDECDIIVALFNPPSKPNSFKNDRMYLNRENIINVAVSRARDYLFVVMPDDSTKNIKDLGLIKKIEGLCKSQNRCMEWQADNIEEMIFGKRDYIEKSSFSTTHQPVNVYGKPDLRYEVRSGDDAVDVQVHIADDGRG